MTATGPTPSNRDLLNPQKDGAGEGIQTLDIDFGQNDAPLQPSNVFLATSGDSIVREDMF